jgi:uncharacterized protein YjbJ (UPF0337 family)
MNWDTIPGNWKQFRGQVKECWGKLTDDDIRTINGKRERLEGLIEERYGRTREEAKRAVDAFCRECQPVGSGTSRGSA